jgi:hypothetical protein
MENTSVLAAEKLELTRADLAMVVYALGSMHTSALTSKNPLAIGMARASLPLCKKLGVNINASDLYPEPGDSK